MPPENRRTKRALDHDDAMLDLALSLASAVRDAVHPLLGQRSSRDDVGRAPGGDVTMRIDETAEEVVAETLAAVGDIAYYSEDRGLVRFGSPRALFVIDPIDGTRPAAAGFEAAVVSIAVVPPDESAPLGAVTGGVVHEIKSGAVLSARRGMGVQLDGVATVITLPRAGDLETMFWGASQRGRPALPVALVLDELIDSCAMRGGYFDLGSAAYTMTRIATGQLDAYVDPGHSMLCRFPVLESQFRAVGDGALCTNFPYDIAAAMLIVQEAGGVVTAPDGSSLDDRAAVGSGEQFGLSVVAAASADLHARILEALDRGMTRLGDGLSAVGEGPGSTLGISGRPPREATT